MNNDTLTKTWFLTAGETDARGLMPVRLVAMRAIETATLHSNLLGIGYADLAARGIGWVLARMSIEMVRYPAINSTYSMSTWIENCGRFLSERCHEMTDADGNILALVRTVWAAIDVEKRTMAPLGNLPEECFPVVERPFPISKLPALKGAVLNHPDAPSRCHRFSYTDIDFNRHVNTISYLLVAINNHGLDFYDRHSIRRLDATFEHECYYDEDIRITLMPDSRIPGSEITELHRPDGRRVAAVRLIFDPPC